MTNSILNRVFTQLARNTSGAGISVALLAARSKTSRDNVRKRVYDLRTAGFDIYTNQKVVNGKIKNFYRLAA